MSGSGVIYLKHCQAGISVVAGSEKTRVEVDYNFSLASSCDNCKQGMLMQDFNGPAASNVARGEHGRSLKQGCTGDFHGFTCQEMEDSQIDVVRRLSIRLALPTPK